MVMTLMSNPKGAVGTVVVATDGSGDTTDIQTGINLLPVAGGCVYIKEGTYNIDVAITIPNDNISITGCGNSTILLATADVTIFNINNVDNIAISRLQIDGSGQTTNNDGIYFNNIERSVIQTCYIHDCFRSGILFVGACDSDTVIANHIFDCGDGIHVVGGRNIISSNFCSSNTATGIICDVAADNLIDGNVCEENGGTGIAIQWRSDNCVVSSNRLENNGGYGIETIRVAYTLIIGNTCQDNTLGGIAIESHVSGQSIFNQIIGNIVDGASTYGIFENTISGSDPDYNSIDGNMISDGITNPILVLGANTKVFNNTELL